jgi:hypothetical protein
VPDIHVPHLEEEDHHTAKPRSRWKSALKLGLEIVLITTGVFLGLAGEQWRESRHHHELADTALRRFRDEFRGNRGEVLRVHDRHVKEMKDLGAYFRAHSSELLDHIVDQRKPMPTPVPDTVTDSAGLDFSAWDFALATQSLAYIDPELVASMSSAYRLQQIYLDAHRSIQQTAYSYTNPVYFLRGVNAYFSDAALYERLLMKRYDDLLPRLDKAIGAK